MYTISTLCRGREQCQDRADLRRSARVTCARPGQTVRSLPRNAHFNHAAPARACRNSVNVALYRIYPLERHVH